MVVTVGGTPPPGAPTLNQPQVTGNTVTLSWAAGSGPAPTSYGLLVRAADGTPIGALPLTGTSVTVPGAPGGTYLLTLVAMNAGGTSAPSNQITLVVP